MPRGLFKTRARGDWDGWVANLQHVLRFILTSKFHRDMFIQAKVIQFFKTDRLSFSILMCKDHGI